jgi:23S rRNA pseudouridine955/2504/2580 synthase
MKQYHKIPFSELIVHEDDAFIIINKPPYIATLEDRNDDHNILEMARDYLTTSKVCHRLDKETSGLLVIAKNDEAYKYFSSLLANREVTKIYHSIVDGRHEIEELELNKPIYIGSNRSKIDYRKGKPSVTLITTLEIYRQHTLLACMPFTGRMHQIRVHLADQQMPIIGDHTYGGTSLFLSAIKKKYKVGKDKEERPLLPRLALHAAGLSFPHQDGQTLKIKAPYPKDLDVTLKQLEKNSS